MTEQVDTAGQVGTGSTGHPQVDGVLATLDGLADVPVENHVAVFEAAHAGLRDALSSAAQTRTEPAAQTPTPPQA